MRPRGASISWPSFLLVAAAAFGVFAPSLSGTFVYDDHRFVEGNAVIRSLADTPRMFLDPRTVAEENWEGIYRPLRTFSFAVDHAIWGLRPFGYHLQGLLWHVAAAVLLLVLLRRLGAPPVPALVGALLFAVHPAQAEAACWISSRGDVLSGALVLLALALHAGPSARPARRGLLVAGVGLLAMLAKEAAVVLAPLVVTLDALLRRPWESGTEDGVARAARLRAHVLRAWVPVVAATVLYVLLRQWRTAIYDTRGAFGHLTGWWGGSFLTQMLVASRGFALHLATLLLPVGPRLDYFAPTDAVIDPGVVLAWLALPALGAVVLATGRRVPAVAVGILWFLLALLPVSNLLFTVGIPSADRFLYLPIAGAALALVPLVRRLPSRALWAAAALILALGALAVRETWRWTADDDRLWVRSPPGSPRALIHQARLAYDRVLALWDAENRPEALDRIPPVLAKCEAALDRWRGLVQEEGVPAIPQVHLWIGNLRRLEGHRREAYDALKNAERFGPGRPKTSYLFGLLIEEWGDPLAALREFQEADRRGFGDALKPHLAQANLEAAQAAQDAGSYGRAMIHLRAAAEAGAGTPQGESAERSLRLLLEEKARSLAAPPPEDGAGWLALGIHLSQLGDWDRALDILLQLSARQPESVPLVLALARWGYEEPGNNDRAVATYLVALSLDPGNADARMGLVRCDGFSRDEALQRDPERRLALLEGLTEDDPRVLVLRARALRDLDRKDEARPLLERAAEMKGPGVFDAIHLQWEEDRHRG